MSETSVVERLARKLVDARAAVPERMDLEDAEADARWWMEAIAAEMEEEAERIHADVGSRLARHTIAVSEFKRPAQWLRTAATPTPQDTE